MKTVTRWTPRTQLSKTMITHTHQIRHLARILDIAPVVPHEEPPARIGVLYQIKMIDDPLSVQDAVKASFQGLAPLNVRALQLPFCLFCPIHLRQGHLDPPVTAHHLPPLSFLLYIFHNTRSMPWVSFTLHRIHPQHIYTPLCRNIIVMFIKHLLAKLAKCFSTRKVLVCIRLHEKGESFP